MEEEQVQGAGHAREEPGAEAALPQGTQPWQAPKLTFVEPKLTQHGTVQEITGDGSFFEDFTPC